MAPYLDVASMQRSLLVYQVGRAAALPVFVFLGWQAIVREDAVVPGAVAMVVGVVGLALVVWAHRTVAQRSGPRAEVLLGTLAAVDAVALLVLMVMPAVLLGFVMGLLVFFLVIDLFSTWTVRTAARTETGRH